jgi:hypothetical protein
MEWRWNGSVAQTAGCKTKVGYKPHPGHLCAMQSKAPQKVADHTTAVPNTACGQHSGSGEQLVAKAQTSLGPHKDLFSHSKNLAHGMVMQAAKSGDQHGSHNSMERWRVCSTQSMNGRNVCLSAGMLRLPCTS